MATDGTKIKLINRMCNLLKICNHLIKKNKIIKAIVVLFLFHVIRKFVYYIYRKYHHLPPGPNGYPIVGCLPFLVKDVKWQVKMAKKYGPIFYFPFVFPTKMIFINDASIIKKLFPQKHWLNRDNSIDAMEKKGDTHKGLFSVGDHHTYPLLFTNGEKWTKRRKHAQTTLFRTMTNSFVGDVLHEAIQNELVPHLDDVINKGKIWYPKDLCQYLAFNTIYHTMFGYRISKDSELYNEMMTDFDNTFKLSFKAVIAHRFRFMKIFKFISEPLALTRNRRNENISKLIEKRIEENKNKNIKQTYIDYTHELVVNGEITKDEEIADTYFLFNAGIDTTSSTLDFGIVLTAKHIDIQDKVRNELLYIMNDDKLFNLKLVHNCPLFRAYIHEILRISSVAYFGVNHISLNKDDWINVNGNRYKIPKNTLVFTNMDYIHTINKKTEHWTNIDGDKIFLDNFLSEDKTRFVMNESFVGFGVGRRDCIGRQLAMKEIQYIMAYLLMNYKISLNKPVGDLVHYKKGFMSTIFMYPTVGVKLEKL